MPPGPGVRYRAVRSVAGQVPGAGDGELRLNHGESESVFDRSCYNVIPEANKL